LSHCIGLFFQKGAGKLKERRKCCKRGENRSKDDKAAGEESSTEDGVAVEREWDR